MQQTFVRSAAAAFFAVVLSAAVFAAEPAEEQPLPSGVVAHISIASPQRLWEGAFAYIDTATRDTGYYIPGEMLPMLLAAYSPLPLDAWDVERELHIFMLGDPEDPDPAAVFYTGSFDEQLLAGLEAAGWAIDHAAATAPEGGEVIADLRSAVMPNGNEMLLAQLMDGRVVLAEDEEDARLVAALEPEHDSGADIVVRARADGPLGEGLAGLSEQLFEEIAGDADDIVESVAEAGLTEETGRWLADLAAEYGRVLGEEIEQAEEFSLELSFVDDRLVAGFSVLSGEGSWIRRLAETIEEMDSSGSSAGASLLGRLPEGYFSAGITAPVTGAMPEMNALSEAVLADIAELAPELKDELLVNNKLLYAAEPGAMASANYMNGGAPYQLLLTEYDDAEAALHAMAGMGGVFNDIASRSFAEPSRRVSLLRETQSADGREWYAWRLESGGAEGGFGDFLRRLERAAPAGATGAGTVFDPGFRIYAARLEEPEALLIATGSLGEEEFAEILRSVAESAGDGETPFDNPDVRATAAAMGVLQFSIGVMKPEDLYLLFAVQYAAMEGEELPAAVFDAEQRSEGADAVFGSGAADGRVTARLALPAAGVNAAIVMHEALGRALEAGE